MTYNIFIIFSINLIKAAIVSIVGGVVSYRRLDVGLE